MQKRTNLIVGIGILLPLLVVVILRPGGGTSLQLASAAHLNTSFTTAYNISNSSNYDSTQHPRLVIAPDTYLHVTWMEGVANTSNGPAYVRGQGTSWPTWEWAGPSNNKGYTNPSIALDSAGTVHVVWAGRGNAPYDIYYAYKPAGGTWSTYQNLSNEGNNSVYADIAIDSQNRIWVTWQASLSDSNSEIYVTNKPAGGTWATPTRMTNNSYQDLNPSIVVDKDNVPHVAWRNNAAGSNWEIYYTKYVNGSWTTALNISSTSSASHFPAIATNSDGNIFAVWEDEIGGQDVFQTLFRRWDGSQWQAYKQVSSSTKALYPFISADGCTIYVVWEDFRGGSTPVAYFSYSTDCGTSWSSDENVSRNSTDSYYQDVVSQSGGFAHIVWQDMAPGQLDIFYSKGTLAGIPTPVPTTQPPTITPTPSPTATPDPRPYGYVDISAHDPQYSHDYTRLLTVTLQFSAASDVGATVTDMRVCNVGETNPSVNCPWTTLVSAMPNWLLLDNGYDCGWKPVWTRFRDNVGRTSITYTDYIAYDNYVTASISLNGDKPYTNRTMVMVHTEDVDLQTLDCSGLQSMAFSSNGLTFTLPISYFPDIYYFLPPSGPVTRTVYAQYRDRANNVGTFSDSIVIDSNAPTGTAPMLNNGVSSTTALLTSISGLSGQDSESGIANIWLANRPDGPWMIVPYCATPPCTYANWNLGYGGPPILAPDQHYVYVKYEDGSGYGPLPGNLSQVYSTMLSVSGIFNAYLPITTRSYGSQTAQSGTVSSGEVDLILLADAERARPGETVLLYLAARREQDAPIAGTLRLMLPRGLRVVRAWSAYGQLLQQEDHLVISYERAWSQQVPWILVQARVEGDAASSLAIQGDMTWDWGIVTAPSVQFENR